MRILTSQADGQRQRRSTVIARLLSITLPGQTTPFQFSDQNLRLTKGGVAGSDEWAAYVLRWGTTQDGLGLLAPEVGTKGTCDLILNNAKPLAGRARLSDWFRSTTNASGNDLAFGLVTVKLLFDTGTVEDAVTVFDGQIDDIQVTSTTLTLRCSERMLEVPDETGALTPTAPGALAQPQQPPITYDWVGDVDLSGSSDYGTGLAIGATDFVTPGTQRLASQAISSGVSGVAAFQEWAFWYRTYGVPGTTLVLPQATARRYTSTGTVNGAVTQVDILSLVPPASSSALADYTYNNPPTVKATLATLSLKATSTEDRSITVSTELFVGARLHDISIEAGIGKTFYFTPFLGPFFYLQ